ncbi:hypothetical protein NA56DRAFT_225283 [Hyaloscypha hepaticicola]|uniref:Uncharacterized protein n=1 Tax=Hyaloscypha hepaticicola TaxID=2082293 RepID=A0A2J6QLI9_9HELO|nr:hypothetical protein NA56DRAFT_225283 [Hyaloscypha hepaticicola]
MPIPSYNMPIPSQYPCSKLLISYKLSISCKLSALYINYIKEDDFSRCSTIRGVVKGAKVWGTAVVIIAVKALTVDSRASGVLDSTGEGLSVINCVTDHF